MEMEKMEVLMILGLVTGWAIFTMMVGYFLEMRNRLKRIDTVLEIMRKTRYAPAILTEQDPPKGLEDLDKDTWNVRLYSVDLTNRSVYDKPPK